MGCWKSNECNSALLGGLFTVSYLDVLHIVLLQVIEGEGSFPGDAGLYGTLDAAMEPSVKNGGIGKCVLPFLWLI